MTSVRRAAIWVGSAPDDQERLSPPRKGRLPATAVAALVMRIVIVIRVVFIFLKIDQTAPLVERYQPFTKSLQLQGNIIFAFYFADAA